MDDQENLYLWRYTHERTGGRRTTRHRMTEAEALQALIAPERVESSLIVVEPDRHNAGWSFASGLVRRADGAMMPPESLRSPGLSSEPPVGATLGATGGQAVSES